MRFRAWIVGRLRDRYVRGEMTLSEYEAEVARVLRHGRSVEGLFRDRTRHWPWVRQGALVIVGLVVGAGLLTGVLLTILRGVSWLLPAASVQTPVAFPASHLRPLPAADPDSPAATVRRFYALAANQHVGDATALLSPRLQQQYSPGRLRERFGATQQLHVLSAEGVAEAASGRDATVFVRVEERRRVGGEATPTSQYWTGTWQLVRGSNGWLLDQPNLVSSRHEPEMSPTSATPRDTRPAKT